MNNLNIVTVDLYTTAKKKEKKKKNNCPNVHNDKIHDRFLFAWFNCSYLISNSLMRL